MSIAIFFAAVIGGLVLDRQEKRHRYERRAEYERLGWEIPPPLPKLSSLESWANVVLGVCLVALGVWFLNAAFRIPPESIENDWLTLIALFVASGIALVWLGLKALQQIRRSRGSSRG